MVKYVRNFIAAYYYCIIWYYTQYKFNIKLKKCLVLCITNVIICNTWIQDVYNGIIK